MRAVKIVDIPHIYNITAVALVKTAFKRQFIVKGIQRIISFGFQAVYKMKNDLFIHCLYKFNVVKIIDPKYYTTAEGSTIINLTQEYLSTLSDGVHTLGIVSLSGTAETTFTISAVSEIPGELSPKTGENTDYSLAIILLVSAVLLIGGTTVYARKKKSK